MVPGPQDATQVTCPDDNALLEFAEGLLGTDDQAEVERHLDACERCLASVCQAVSQDASAPQAGLTVGRYVVVDVLGRGAMGIVYRAFDPELDRAVAVKVLAPAIADGVDERRRTQLVREAKTLAGLSHPNILVVHDAGLTGRQLFVATELVDGGDLRTWLTSAPGPAAIVRVFDQIADGLAAAHDAGVVHRDVKPENLLLDKSGRPRLGDFGLASLVETSPGIDGSVAASRSTCRAGTVLYMAPEQLDGHPANTRSDQFSFCVTLYEALVGTRPFEADSADALRRAHDAPLTIPHRAGVSRKVRAVLRRGLSADPALRFPSMRALRSALGSRRLARITTIATLGAAGLLWVGLSPGADERCTGARAALGDVGTAQRRARVRARLVAADAGPPTIDRVNATLSHYAEDWIAAHTEACRATAVRQERSAETLKQTMACLAGARRKLRAVTDVLIAVEPDKLAAADRIVAVMPSLQDCSNLEALQSGAAPVPEAVAARYNATLRHVAAIDAWMRAGSFEAAAAERAAARAAAQGIDYPPLQTYLARADGDLALYVGDFTAAEQHYRQVVAHATEHRQQGELARAAIQLVTIVGSQLDRPDEGLVYADLARAATTNKIVRADIEANVGRLYLSRGDAAKAEVTLNRALALNPEGTNWLNHTAIRGDLLDLYRVNDRLDEAEPLARVLVQAYRDRVGDAHPDFALAQARLAAVLYKRGRNDEAAQLYAPAVSRLEAAWGNDHPTVAAISDGYASVLTALGRYAEAAALGERSLVVSTERFGAEHPMTIVIRSNVARARSLAGNVEEAEREYRAVLALQIALVGEQDANTATLRANLGGTQLILGQLDEAASQLRQALRVHRSVRGDNDPRTALTRFKLARALMAAGNFEGAEAHLEAAIAVDPNTVSPATLASYRIGLVDLLVESCRLEEARTQMDRAWPVLTHPGVPPHRWARAATTRAMLLTREGGDRTEAQALLSDAATKLAPGDRLEAARIRLAQASPPTACPPVSDPAP